MNFLHHLIIFIALFGLMSESPLLAMKKGSGGRPKRTKQEFLTENPKTNVTTQILPILDNSDLKYFDPNSKIKVGDIATTFSTPYPRVPLITFFFTTNVKEETEEEGTSSGIPSSTPTLIRDWNKSPKPQTPLYILTKSFIFSLNGNIKKRAKSGNINLTEFNYIQNNIMDSSDFITLFTNLERVDLFWQGVTREDAYHLAVVIEVPELSELTKLKVSNIIGRVKKEIGFYIAKKDIKWGTHWWYKLRGFKDDSKYPDLLLKKILISSYIKSVSQAWHQRLRRWLYEHKGKVALGTAALGTAAALYLKHKKK